MATEEDDQLFADTESWRSRADIDGLLKCYFGSPKFSRLVLGHLQEYEGLKDRLLLHHTPFQSWQIQLETWLDDAAQVVKDEVKPLPLDKKHHGLCPLSIRKDQFGRAFSQDRLYAWDSMLTNWGDFRQLFDSNDRFQQYLSPSQRASYLLLRDWWDGLYCDPYFPRQAQAYFDSQRTEQCAFDPAQKRYLLRVEKAKTHLSLYHSSCFSLFLMEFHPRSWEPYMSLRYLERLQRARVLSSSNAQVQRLSFAALYPHHRGPDRSFPKHIKMTQWATDKEPKFRPLYLWDTERNKTVRSDSIAGNPDYICISHTWGRWRLESLPVAGVPWDVPRNQRFDVESLPESLKLLGDRFIWIDLFCIPQDNSHEAKQEIGRQASIFGGCRKAIAWLNDVDSWDGVRKGLHWLGLQAQRNTMRPYESPSPGYLLVADADLEAAEETAEVPTELLPIPQQIEAEDTTDKPNRWLSPRAILQRKNTSQALQLQFQQQRERERLGPEVTGWFTSLWTLQEAVLCPEITLCSRNWTVLSDGWGAPIPLQSLIVFIKRSADFCVFERPLAENFATPKLYDAALATTDEQTLWPEVHWPQAAWNLLSFVSSTALDHLMSNMSISIICSIASTRSCTSKNRAPAIMSALGVTSWYEERERSSTTRLLGRIGSIRNMIKYKQPYVLGMYPVEFLEEARTRHGASFFDMIIANMQDGLYLAL